MRKLEIGKNEACQRMDKYLKKYFKDAGSGFLYKMLRKKNILLNDKKADGKEILSEGDTITLYLAEDTIEKFRGSSADSVRKVINYPQTTLDVLYEDEDYLILNKPSGILSQKATPDDVSMVEYLTGYLLQKGDITPRELETFHPSVCNRLDRNTSGIILAGKTLSGLQILSQFLKERTMKKYYLCLVKGRIEKSQYCRAYLLKNKSNNQVRILNEPVDGAQYIETSYDPLWCGSEETLLKVDLITGKSHQIRSHLASLGYPLAGDPKYGSSTWNQLLRKQSGLKRQFLHAWEIDFPHLDSKGSSLSEKSIHAPLPADLEHTLTTVGCPVKEIFHKQHM
ncbi:MAG: RluA family pseudouridine synthase [Clostridia bacterium]|nr:RluA family pseudouridine synthase [Clostridia bacterium]NCC44356.1 RluA family pseudouridine synthase [Clostridia bacterium]